MLLALLALSKGGTPKRAKPPVGEPLIEMGCRLSEKRTQSHARKACDEIAHPDFSTRNQDLQEFEDGRQQGHR